MKVIDCVLIAIGLVLCGVLTPVLSGQPPPIIVRCVPADFAVNVPIDVCKPSSGLPMNACNQLIRRCKCQHNIELKWTGPGCPGKRGDGGCQCANYCNWACSAKCNADPLRRCAWIGKRCINRYTGLPTGPMLTCGTPAPSASPTTSTPSQAPSRAPTHSPTFSPTNRPTTSPTLSPTSSPTHSPSASPTKVPTKSPTHHPTSSPTRSPSASPTKSPTHHPTASPTHSPSASPTHLPTRSPTNHPSASPSNVPSASPTYPPTTLAPSTLTPTSSSPTNVCEGIVGLIFCVGNLTPPCLWNATSQTCYGTIIP